MHKFFSSVVIFYNKGRCFHLSPGSHHGKPLCWCQRAKRPMQSLKNLQSFLKKMTSLLILGMMVSYPRALGMKFMQLWILVRWWCMNPCWPLHKWEGWTDGHAIWCGEKCSFLWDGKGLRVLYKKLFLGKAWHCVNMSGEHKGNMPLQRPLGSHEFWGCGKCEFPRSNSKSRILGS